MSTTTRSSAVRQSIASLKMMAVMTLLVGLAYPLLVWGVGQLVARDQAAGSLVESGGQVVGSSLLGQSWTGAEWFHGRPSASDSAGDVSGGTNLGPSSHGLADAVAERREASGLGDAAPADALTASGSGLDPHISPEYARAQVQRVAGARGLPAATVQRLVDENTQGRTLGFLGSERVNVLELNLALTRATG